MSKTMMTFKSDSFQTKQNHWKITQNRCNESTLMVLVTATLTLKDQLLQF